MIDQELQKVQASISAVDFSEPEDGITGPDLVGGGGGVGLGLGAEEEVGT